MRRWGLFFSEEFCLFREIGNACVEWELAVFKGFPPSMILSLPGLLPVPD